MFEEWNKLLICDKEIRNIDAGGMLVGYEFRLQYPSYRGTFLSCIESFEVSVESQDLEPVLYTQTTCGQTATETRCNEQGFMLEVPISAPLYFQVDGFISEGEYLARFAAQ